MRNITENKNTEIKSKKYQIKEYQIKGNQIKENQIKENQIKENQIKENQNEEIKNKKIKWAVTIVAALLLMALYIIIFLFSSQDSDESGSLSLMISEKCVDIVNNVAGKNWTYAVKLQIAELLEHPIRKLAHFTEYTCMGILVYSMWRPWKPADRKLYFLTVIWVFISASFDEAHQFFVPGRYNSIADVLLDTAGGIFGLLICTFIRKYIKKFIPHFFKWTA